MAISHQPLSFRWPSEFIDSIDAARGDVPRSTFVRRAVEAALLRANGYEPTSADRQALPPSPTEVPPTPSQGRQRYNQPFIPRAIPPCPDCGKANGVHKGDCPAHPRSR